MAIVFVLAHMLGRPASAPYAIMLAAAGMVAATPTVLFDVSFQLSFAGTFAIAALAPTLSQRFLSGDRGLRGATLDLVLINTVAVLATIPLIALHFERVSLVSLPANLLTTPLFAWMFLGAASTGVAGLISEGLGAVLAWPLAWLPLRWFVLIGEGLAGSRGADTTVPGFGHIHVIVIYVAMALVAIRPYREHLRPPAIRAAAVSRAAPILASGVLAAAALAVWLAAAPRTELLQVHFLDVGQGDATAVRTPAGQTILIDGGADGDVLVSQLRDALPSGASRIDLVIVTHPQLDHAGGIISLFDRYELGQIVVSPLHDGTSLGRRLRDLGEERQVPVMIGRIGDRIVFPDDDGQPRVALDVLWPPRAIASMDDADLNAQSMVVRLSYGTVRVLFAADIGAAEELELARQVCAGEPCDLRAEVLKAPHHGSAGSTTDLLLRRASPSLAVISAGASNPHGHPHADVIELLERHGVAVVQTAERGRITILSDGQSVAWEAQR